MSLPTPACSGWVIRKINHHFICICCLTSLISYVTYSVKEWQWSRGMCFYFLFSHGWRVLMYIQLLANFSLFWTRRKTMAIWTNSVMAGKAVERIYKWSCQKKTYISLELLRCSMIKNVLSREHFCLESNSPNGQCLLQVIWKYLGLFLFSVMWGREEKNEEEKKTYWERCFKSYCQQARSTLT